MNSLTRRLKAYKRPRGISARQQAVSSAHVENAGFIAVISFHGKIPDGSEGKSHAEFVTLQCLEALARLDAICIIIDFRDVQYKWGNSLLRVFDTLRKHLYYEWHDVKGATPVKFLASDKSAGLYSLIGNPNTFFETMEAAVESCGSDLELWLPE